AGRGGEAPGHPALHGCSRHHPGPPCGARRRRAGRRGARWRRAGPTPQPGERRLPPHRAEGRGGRLTAVVRARLRRAMSRASGQGDKVGPTIGQGAPCVCRIHSFVAAVALAACVAGTTAAADRITGKPFATRSEVHAPHAIAATSHPLPTPVALDVMNAGGSAVDAAIASNAALGLMEPTGNGIGGDLFAIVWDPKTRRLYGYNGSGRSPRSLTLEEFRRRGLEE